MEMHYMVSNCCGATALGELDEIWGRCSDCKEMAEFELEQ